jgi:diguanylate cyclase (GGDEF)-like protein
MDIQNTKLTPYVWILGVVWSLSVAASLSWNLYQNNQELLVMARTQARVAHGKDVVYRSWNASHTKVYVPMEGDTKPNPYLGGPNRDLVTVSGQMLTQVNPAYMTRQAHEIESEVFGVRSHITSLNPIRPQNAPDPWEREALKAFVAAKSEVSSVESMDGRTYMRLMRPLLVEKTCLRCHGDQDYRVGDILGGISVSVPMEPLSLISRKNNLMLSITHGALWLLGLVGLGIGVAHVKQRVRERNRAEESLRSANQQLEQLSKTDGLTGLYNRRHLMEALQAEHSRSQRYGHTIGLLMIDIDHFKRINDEFGHPCGDMVLQEVAKLLQVNVRSSDLVGRYGGEEMLIVLPETDISEALEVGEKLRSVIEQHSFNYDGTGVKVTASVGVSALQAKVALSWQQLLKHADEALYQAKRSGRNKVAKYSV